VLFIKLPWVKPTFFKPLAKCRRQAEFPPAIYLAKTLSSQQGREALEVWFQ
jgi:hypothetical protein